MQVELLMALARIYCDNEWALYGKCNFPTEDRLGWIGLDHARLQWLIKNEYVISYIKEGETRLTVSPAGLDSLCVEQMRPTWTTNPCDMCGELSHAIWLAERDCGPAYYECPTCRKDSFPSNYFDRCGLYGLPIPVVFVWDGNGWSEK